MEAVTSVCRITIRNMSAGRAPMAIRIPNSCVRSATE